MKIILVSLFLFSYSAFAASPAETTEQSFTDSVKQVSDGLINDINKDALNSRFLFKLTNVGQDMYGSGSNDVLDYMPESTLLASFGIHLLPNTWRISLGYSTTVGDDLLFASSAIEDYENVLDSGSTQFANSENDDGMTWLDFYMKPVTTNFGTFGFGYRQIEKYNVGVLYGVGEILDLTDGSGAYTTPGGGTPTVIESNSKTSRIYLTYHIPAKNKWYDGFGFSIAQEDSDQFKVIDDATSVVLSPDRNTQIISIGIRKTTEEIKHGFSFRNLTFGIVTNEYDYFNYNTSQNESLSTTGTQMIIDGIYMFKAKNHRQAYVSVQFLNREEEDTSYVYQELTGEFGMRF